MAQDDLALLERVLDLAATRKLRVSALSVGSIRLVLSGEPGDPPKPKPYDKMAAMRERGRKLFGRDLPDEQLKEMEGVV